jgi:hypothetical protein
VRSQPHRLDLATPAGRKLVAEIRTAADFIGDATVVRVFSPDRPEMPNMIRVSVLREMQDRIDFMGFEDNDPLSVGHGNICRVLAWVDELNEEGEGERGRHT